MKTACIAAMATLGCASAFVAPTAFTGSAVRKAPKSSSSMKMAFEDAEGAQAPLGFFDPLGLLNDADQERFDRLRYVEVKHGRISMLAIAGHLVQQNVRLPGYLSISENIKFTDVPNGLAAFSKIPAAGIAQLVAFIGFLELAVMQQVEGSTPGDMNRFGENSTWASWDEETQSRKASIELNNGRAQMGILALMVHEQLNGRPYIINDILGQAYTWN
nr:chlorophyll a/c-binding protein precursor - Giraudyopsis stellifer [Giraudyopsis stellifera]